MKTIEELCKATFGAYDYHEYTEDDYTICSYHDDSIGEEMGNVSIFEGYREILHLTVYKIPTTDEELAAMLKSEITKRLIRKKNNNR